MGSTIGRSNFLETMAKRGFDVYGTELSSLSETRAGKLFGDRIRVGQLADAKFSDKTVILLLERGITLIST